MLHLHTRRQTNVFSWYSLLDTKEIHEKAPREPLGSRVMWHDHSTTFPTMRTRVAKCRRGVKHTLGVGWPCPISRPLTLAFRFLLPFLFRCCVNNGLYSIFQHNTTLWKEREKKKMKSQSSSNSLLLDDYCKNREQHIHQANARRCGQLGRDAGGLVKTVQGVSGLLLKETDRQ